MILNITEKLKKHYKIPELLLAMQTLILLYSNEIWICYFYRNQSETLEPIYNLYSMTIFLKKYDILKFYYWIIVKNIIYSLNIYIIHSSQMILKCIKLVGFFLHYLASRLF